MTKTIDPATFKRGKFHLLDLKCGQPFSKPIRDIHKEIKSKFMSTVIWQRVSKCIHTTFQDLLPAKKRMIDPKNTLTYTQVLGNMTHISFIYILLSQRSSMEAAVHPPQGVFNY